MTDYILDDVSAAGRDPRAHTDELRPRYPVVRNDAGEWVLLRHADVVAAALDDVRFSSAVSHHLQIPNGLNGEDHAKLRRVIDRHLNSDSLAPFLPVFEGVAKHLVATLSRGESVDAVGDIGAVFAVRAQCAWLGWPTELEPRLLNWMEANHAATRSGDYERKAKVAEEFDAIIRSVLAPRLAGTGAAGDDVTTRLCRETVDGRPLTELELISVLRNWTGGDLGSMALCIGVLIAHLAREPDLAQRMRTSGDAKTDAVIDEILRLDDPFVSNRRVTTCPIRIGGADLPAGARVKLHWTSANRDEAVFDRGGFAPEAHAAANLVYGIGRHACPGRLLATSQMRIMLRTLLASIRRIDFASGKEPEREVSPLGGFRRVWVMLD